MFLANKLNKGAGAPPATTDPQFNYVTMLLHGDGTNGAQNNTFLDSSTNNFTITRNGNTTQGSFSPYGSNWSNNFVSSATTYFVTPSSSSLALGTGDFTVEAWVNYSSLIGGGRGIFQFSATTSLPLNTNSLALGASSNGAIGWNLYANNSDINSGVPVALGTWYHVAVVRSSGTTKLYVNGTSVISQADSKDYTQTYLIIGGFYSTGFLMDGYISNFRVVKGTAVYTANFTPSTTPLTAISGTSLLTCADNRFIDDSTNNFTLTVNGTPSVQRFNPFGASTAYSTSVIGGSGYFDGTGDYLSIASTSELTLTGDYTVESWVYVINPIAGFERIWNNAPGTTPSGFWYFYVGSGATLAMYNVDVGTLPTVGTYTPYAWNHLAVSRSGSTTRVFVNGIQTYSYSGSTTFTNNGWYIGGGPDDEHTNCYISNHRVVVGTAVYTSNFTPPTSPVTAITNTKLLCNFTNGAIFDNAMMGDLETVGNAQISTSVVKYGTGSMSFNGSNSYLTTLGNPLFAFGTGDFTIECWLNITSFNGGVVIDFRPTSTNGDQLLVYLNGSTLELYASGDTRIASGTLTTATWFHFALSRSGSSMKMFINGTQAGSTYTASVNYTVGTKLGIGTSTFALGSSILDGYIDDLRITKGYARYTANFTPPTAAFLNIGPN
jgi:hypothetical protein